MDESALHDALFAEWESQDLRDWPTYEGWLEFMALMMSRELAIRRAIMDVPVSHNIDRAELHGVS